MMLKSVLSLFPELFEFVSDLESELEASMYKVFWLNSDSFSLVATAPTIPMPSLLDTKNQSNMTIPSKCHLTWYDTVDCIVEPLPLPDLPIVGQSDKQAKAMMHGDEGICADGLKELDPDPSSHDSFLDGDIMEHAQSNIHYELVPLLRIASNHVISAFQ
jgi:hypothetical protein